MRLGAVSAFPGQTGVFVPVLATNGVPLQGFTLAATYDPRVLRVDSVETSDSNIAHLRPELVAVNISEDPVDPYVTLGLLVDFSEPFDGRVIEPGVNRRLANIIIDVSPRASPGTSTRILLADQVGKPPLNNIFTVAGQTLFPVLAPGGEVVVRQLRFPPPRFFLRGDADTSGAIDLTDAISILGFLFAGDSTVACDDAADVTDDGVLDLSDAIYLLDFLFQAGSYPLPPYPDWGMDPTPDGLDECLLR